MFEMDDFDEAANKMMKRFYWISGICIAFLTAAVCGLGYVAWHFISKFW